MWVVSGVCSISRHRLSAGDATDVPFATLRTQIAPGSSLLLFSDGVTEIFVEPAKLWGSAGLIGFVRAHPPTDPRFLDELRSSVMSIAKRDILADDYSTVLARFT